MQFTFDDYIKAKQFLIDVGRYREFTNNPFSVDGYSLI